MISLHINKQQSGQYLTNAKEFIQKKNKSDCTVACNVM